METEAKEVAISKRRTTNGWSWSVEIEVNAPNGIVKQRDDDTETNLKFDENEKTPLIDGKSTTEIEHSVYGKVKHYSVETTWRHWLIGPVVCLYFFGMISSYYVLLEYTKQYWKEEEYEKANLSLSETSSACDTNVSQLLIDTEHTATSKASKWVVYYSAAAGVPALLSNLILGSYTDAFGRKFLLTVCILGTCLRLAISAVVIHFEADLIYLLIACLIEGCTGQHATCLSVTLAYAADITRPGKTRIMGIVAIEILIGISLSSSSFATGYMVEALGYETPMIMNAGLLALSILITISLLPETLSKELRRKDKSMIQVLKVVSEFFTQNDEKNSRWKYQIVILMHALTNMSFLARIPTETLYQLATPFCWTPTKVGIYAAVRTLCMMFLGKWKWSGMGWAPLCNNRILGRAMRKRSLIRTFAVREQNHRIPGPYAGVCMVGRGCSNLWRSNAWMRLCACAVWCESTHFPYDRRHCFAWRGPFSKRLVS